MVKGFYDDLKAAKKGESIVLNVLKSITTDYEFDDVSNDKTYWHIGDISVYDNAWDCHYYIDVKDTDRIFYEGDMYRILNIDANKKLMMKTISAEIIHE